MAIPPNWIEEKKFILTFPYLKHFIGTHKCTKDLFLFKEGKKVSSLVGPEEGKKKNNKKDLTAFITHEVIIVEDDIRSYCLNDKKLTAYLAYKGKNKNIFLLRKYSWRPNSDLNKILAEALYFHEFDLSPYEMENVINSLELRA